MKTLIHLTFSLLIFTSLGAAEDATGAHVAPPAQGLQRSRNAIERLAGRIEGAAKSPAAVVEEGLKDADRESVNLAIARLREILPTVSDSLASREDVLFAEVCVTAVPTTSSEAGVQLIVHGVNELGLQSIRKRPVGAQFDSANSLILAFGRPRDEVFAVRLQRTELPEERDAVPSALDDRVDQERQHENLGWTLLKTALASVGGIGVILVAFSKSLRDLLSSLIKGLIGARDAAAQRNFEVKKAHLDKFVGLQYEGYVTVWRDLFRLQKIVDALWKRVTERGIISLGKALKEARDHVSRDAFLFQDDHFDRLTNIFRTIDAFDTGKRTLRELSLAENEGMPVSAEKMEEQIAENGRIKKDLEELLESIRRDFHRKLGDTNA